jgi:EF-hand domain-containing protein 1
MKKMFKQDMHTLRFEASLVSTEPDDETRQFIISFYCGDDTVQIYEICDKNSGRMGGRFMERKKQTNPVNGKYYTERDFLIGNVVFLAGFKFRILKGDEYTLKYMEDNAAVFPAASIEHIVEKIKKASVKFPSLQDYAIHLMKTLDKNNDGFVDVSEFSACLQSLNIFLTKQEEHTLLRRFDQNGDGKVSMEEFYNTLA